MNFYSISYKYQIVDLMGKVKRLMMYFSDENLKELNKEAKKQGHPSVQALIRQIIRDSLDMELPIIDFHSDVLCPQCGVAGQLVKYSDGKISCLNCNYSST
jgi:hypothetical protein